MATVARINVTPVKGLGLLHPDEVELTERGVEANRRYYLIQGWRLFNGKELDFGVYFDVEQPGRVRVGDAVQPL